MPTDPNLLADVEEVINATGPKCIGFAAAARRLAQLVRDLHGRGLLPGEDDDALVDEAWALEVMQRVEAIKNKKTLTRGQLLAVLGGKT